MAPAAPWVAARRASSWRSKNRGKAPAADRSGLPPPLQVNSRHVASRQRESFDGPAVGLARPDEGLAQLSDSLRSRSARLRKHDPETQAVRCVGRLGEKAPAPGNVDELGRRLVEI